MPRGRPSRAAKIKLGSFASVIRAFTASDKFTKLEASTRTQAVAIGIRHGLIE